MDLPTFSSASFVWHRRKGTASLGELGLQSFPTEGFYLRSHRTGEIRRFTVDSATMEANEFFDGEGYAFQDGSQCVNIHIWA